MFLSMFLSEKQIHAVDPPPRTTPLLHQSSAFLFQSRWLLRNAFGSFPWTQLCVGSLASWIPWILFLDLLTHFIPRYSQVSSWSKVHGRGWILWITECLKNSTLSLNGHFGWVQVSSYTRSIFHFFFPDFLVFSLFSLASSLYSFYGIL